MLTLHLDTPLFIYPLPPARAGNPYADSVVVGTTFACVLPLLLITLTVARYYLIHTKTTIEKVIPVQTYS